MARTALTVTTVPAFGGIATAYAAGDMGNGNKFVNTGREVLLINNTHGSTVVVTVTSGADRFGRTVSKTLSLATTLFGAMGPFPPAAFNQSDGTVNVDYDAGTTAVKFCVAQITVE